MKLISPKIQQKLICFEWKSVSHYWNCWNFVFFKVQLARTVVDGNKINVHGFFFCNLGETRQKHSKNTVFLQKLHEYFIPNDHCTINPCQMATHSCNNEHKKFSKFRNFSIHKFYIFHNQDSRMLWLHFGAVFSLFCCFTYQAHSFPPLAATFILFRLVWCKKFSMQFYTTKEIERENVDEAAGCCFTSQKSIIEQRRTKREFWSRHTGPWLETSRDFSIHVAFSAVTQCAFEVFISFSSFLFRNTNHSQVKRQIATRWKENLRIQNLLFIERHKSHRSGVCVISCCLCLHFYFLDQVPSSTMVIKNLCLETPRMIVPAKVSGFKRAARIDDFMERTLLPITEGRVSRAPALHKCLCVCALPPFQHRIVAPKSLEAAVVCFGMEAAARDAQQLRSFVFDFLPFFPKGANFFRRDSHLLGTNDSLQGIWHA